MDLFSYFRSSAAYRTRIALAFKGLEYNYRAVHLVRGEQRSEQYREVNPQGVVPTLVDGQATIVQSLAQLEYLEEKYPDPPLLPKDLAARARVRGLSLVVACDIHPLQNMPLGRYLQREFGATEAQVQASRAYFTAGGLQTLEQLLAGSPETGSFCHGEHPSLADVCLVPQLANAARFGLDLGEYPTLQRIGATCDHLPAFLAAHPSRQPDAE